MSAEDDDKVVRLDKARRAKEDPTPEPEQDDWAASLPTDDELRGTKERDGDRSRDGVTALGHDRGVHYYLSHAGKQVIGLTAPQHNKPYLTQLASVPHYWARSIHVGKKGNIKWDAIANDLMRQCQEIGIYDPDIVRGRGAWFDDGRAVLHLGNRLIVDGVESVLDLVDSRCVYEAALPMLRDLPPPLTVHDANKLAKICRMFKWERPIEGVLLAGFLVIAPICGALNWRPSIWLTGPSGSGKTYLYERVIVGMLRGIALLVQSKTTEAGIRQALGSDARPVAFEEAEAEDSASQARMQAVLDLLRQSSSETGGDILKGTQGHIAKRFKIRSVFALVSINIMLQHTADESRVTPLSLRQHDSNPDAFAELHACVSSVITAEYAAAMIARSARMIPIIRQNAETLARAVSLRVRSQRIGDQIGTLLAGAYSLHSDGLISPEEAAAYVAKQEWDAVMPAGEPDEERLLARLMQHRVHGKWFTDGPAEATIAQLIEAAAGRDTRIPSDAVDAALRSLGFRLGELEEAPGVPGVFVSNTHTKIAEIVEGTGWAAKWKNALKRLKGAVTPTETVRISTDHKPRVTWLPLTTIFPGDE
jgi:putative DNA primase/helicase